VTSDLSRRVFSPEDRQRITQAVRAAEAGTSGEIVVMVVSDCDEYRLAALRGGVLLGVPLAMLLTPPLGGLLWLGPQSLWLFLGLFTVAFGVGYLATGHCHAFRRWLTPGDEMAAEVRQAAEAAFIREGLQHTRAQSGVLIFVALFERRVQVLADRGILALLTQESLQGLATEIAAGIRQQRATDAICDAVARIGALLAQQFPAAADNPNELPDVIDEG
jgi:putative membrane protein